MSIDLRLRYSVSGDTRMLALVAKDGTLRPLATVSLNTTRSMPDAEQAWRSILGSAIETAAEAAEAS